MNVPGTIHVAPASTQIGRDGNTGDTMVFDGILDEARISDVIRNASWIKTEYYNQQNPSTFYQIGPEMLNSRFILSNPIATVWFFRSTNHSVVINPSE